MKPTNIIPAHQSALRHLVYGFMLNCLGWGLLICPNPTCSANESQGDEINETAQRHENIGVAGGEPDNQADWRSSYRKEIYRPASGGALPYRLLPPAGYNGNLTKTTDKLHSTDIKSEKYPLVLFLHGAGERGVDNEKQLVHAASDFAKVERRNKFPSFILFPQCPNGQRWVESDWALKSGKNEFPVTPSEPMSMVLKLVDSLQETLPIDSGRIYVTGLSMGGMGAWYAAGSEPYRFAAMLQICGGGDPTWADRYQGLPIWAFHGQSDTVVPVLRGREMISALSQAGHWPELRYSEYPGVGHNSWTQTYQRDDIFEWLFSQRKN